jgi:Na+/H+-dicarboxylate symporter/ABC-type amino acid transport substrate-binding protein
MPSGVVVGLLAGVATGLFLGDLAAILAPVAEAYVRLLRVTVLPYVTVSLISSIGGLTRTQLALLVKRVGVIVLAIWGLTLGIVFLMPATFPHWERASFFSTSLLEPPEQFDFVGMYIPANPFHSLANGVVPAVVVFSILLGVALIGVAERDRLIDWLMVVKTALGNVTAFIVRLAPFGLFAVTAMLAGTLRGEELHRVQVYLLTYGVFASLLALWLMPGLVCALTPIGYREFLVRVRDGVVLAALTGELFVALPMLAAAGKELVRQHSPPESGAGELTDVIVPASFTFPHAGKVLTLSFIPFAAWFSETALDWSTVPVIAITGVLASFASVNTAIPFLLDLVRIPADTFNLFITTGLINSRVGTLVAAIYTVVIAVIGAYAVSGRLSWSGRRIVRYATVSMALLVVTAGGLRVGFDRLVDQPYTGDRLLTQMQLLDGPANAAGTTGATVSGQEPPEASQQLAQIRARGVVRVGYLPDSLPYAFTNQKSELVGFDVEMAHHLARELAVAIEFVMIEEGSLAEAISAGAIDIVMSGIAMTTGRAEYLTFSAPYLEEHVAFVVADHARATFATLDHLRDMRRLRVAVPNVPYYIDKLRERLPHAEIVVLHDRDDVGRYLASSGGQADALAMTAERGSAWTLLYPQYSVVVPQPQVLTVPLAYPLAADDQRFVSFVDNWLELKRRDGTISRLYDYWILGKNAAPRQPRWSIVRNVLHWVD